MECRCQVIFVVVPVRLKCRLADGPGRGLEKALCAFGYRVLFCRGYSVEGGSKGGFEIVGHSVLPASVRKSVVYDVLHDYPGDPQAEKLTIRYFPGSTPSCHPAGSP
jgi:hypothetical protein